MNYRDFLLLLITVGLLFNLAIATVSATSVPVNQTLTDLTHFVDNATAFAEKYGQELAFNEFNNKNGSFFQNDLYIYVYDLNGTVLAHPVNPELIGKNRYMEKDAIGTFFIQNLQNAAINKTGFTRYTYINPVHNNTIEEKLGYVRMVDNQYWLGSGIYGGVVEQGKPSTLNRLMENIAELVSFVEEARKHVETVGKEQALKDFVDPNGTFINGDRYIMAYDLNSINLAHPYHPEFIGQDKSDVTDENGTRIGDKLVRVATDQGKGFALFYWEEPTTKTVKPKLTYVCLIDDWYIESGIYL